MEARMLMLMLIAVFKASHVFHHAAEIGSSTNIKFKRMWAGFVEPRAFSDQVASYPAAAR
jgi:hypothetical protein